MVRRTRGPQSYLPPTRYLRVRPLSSRSHRPRRSRSAALRAELHPRSTRGRCHRPLSPTGLCLGPALAAGKRRTSKSCPQAAPEGTIAHSSDHRRKSSRSSNVLRDPTSRRSRRMGTVRHSNSGDLKLDHRRPSRLLDRNTNKDRPDPRNNQYPNRSRKWRPSQCLCMIPAWATFSTP